MERISSNIFESDTSWDPGVEVAFFRFTNEIAIEKIEQVAAWFQVNFRKPATSYYLNGKHGIAVATDQIVPLEIDVEQEQNKLVLDEEHHFLTPELSQDRHAVENLFYRSIETTLRRNEQIWLKSKQNRTYCEVEPQKAGKDKNLEVYACFRISAEYLKNHKLGLILDSTTRVAERNTLLDAYLSKGEEKFNSIYPGKYVIHTDSTGIRRTRFFQGIKIGYSIDDKLVHLFSNSDEKISVRAKFQNTNKITGKTFVQNELVAEIKNYSGQDGSQFVPLSTLQYTPDFEELKDEDEMREISELIYLDPGEKFERIRSYLSFFENIEFGKYNSEVKVKFESVPVSCDTVFESPHLSFGNSKTVIQTNGLNPKEYKNFKGHSLSKYGYFRPPDLDSIIIIHRNRFDKHKANILRNKLIDGFRNYNLRFTEENVNVISQLENTKQIEGFIERVDPEVLLGVIAIVEDHNFPYKNVKETLHKHNIPSQAVREETLLHLDPSDRRYNAVIENLIAGIVTKSDGVPWILGSRLSSDLFIGIDSGGKKNKRAWATVYVFNEHGEKIHVRNPKHFSREGIEKTDFREIVIDSVSKKLLEEGADSKVDGIMVHRDGFLTNSELEGLEAAINELSLRGMLQNNFHCAAVNIKKTSNLRLFRSASNYFSNPPIGSYHVLDDNHGFITTTGLPILSSPTARPLLVELRMIRGKLSIEDAMLDVYYLSELNWGSPSASIKLPVTTYYADKMIDFADYEYKPPSIPI